MSTTNECLEYIIGLSQTECDCFDVDKPTDYNRSDSSLFLDQTDGLDLKIIGAEADCETGSLWEMMATARVEAVKEVKTKLLQGISLLAKLNRQPWSGLIGDNKFKFTKDFNPAGAYAGFSVICADIVSGYMKLRQIPLLFKQSATFDIELWCNYSDVALASWSVTSQANKLTYFDLPAPLELPMSRNEVRHVQYWLIFDSSLVTPKDTVISCGCGTDIPTWLPSSPTFYNCYYEGRRIKERWPEYVMARGMSGNVIADRAEDWNSTTETNGLGMVVDFGCHIGEIICRDHLDFEGNVNAMVLAYAVRFKAAEKLIEKILATGNLSRYTMLDRERLWGKRDHYRAQHDLRIDYLAEELTKPEVINSVSDCFHCQDEHGFALGQILS